ncbi:MAG TPA: hypothetical protein VHR72_03700 [Gemmataceae bacterium]|jgi:hypothetical protein|nr:hypothetical protein [Gemmataceae bacterium]
MRLRIAALALILSTTVAGLALAGGDGVAGRWKCNFVQDTQTVNFWMVDLQNKDGKLVGAVVPTRSGLPGGKIDDLVVDGDLLRFVLKLENGIEFRFEGKLPRAGGKKILGSVQRAGTALNPAFLEATKAKNAFELMQETVTRSPNDPHVFNTLLDLVPLAAKEKMAAKDLREMVDGVLASSEAYGPTLHADFGVRLIDALASDYPALAVEAAAKVEKTIDPKSETRLQLLSTLVSSLKKLGRADEAAKFAVAVEAAEGPAFKAYEAKEFDFKVPPSTAKGARPVLVELFTGAQCAPCVAADLACDALEKSFGDDQAILLQYHLHIPGPDPLTAIDNMERVGFYGDSFRGTPAAFFNGRYTVKGGGGAEDAEDKFKEYARVVDKCAGVPETAKVTATATRKGDAISIKAEVKSGETGKVKLRVMLTEDWIRYKGSNGVRYHRNVVRAMPGGVEGFGGNPKGFDKELTIDLAKLRTDLSASLDAFATKEEVRFPSAQRPMRLQNLHVVAFLQSDDNGEVLAVTRVPVKTAGE